MDHRPPQRSPVRVAVLLMTLAVIAALPPGPTLRAQPADTLAAIYLPSLPRGPVAAEEPDDADPAPGVTMLQIATRPTFPLPHRSAYVHGAPWYTLYADGTLITRRSDSTHLPDPYDLVTGRLAEDEQSALVAALRDEAKLLELEDRPFEPGCLYDAPATTIFFRSGAHHNLVRIYALGWYRDGRDLCGDEAPPEIVRLAEVVHSLRSPPDAARPYAMTRATLVQGTQSDVADPDRPPWPADLPLEGELHDVDARRALSLLREHRTSRSQVMVPFTRDDHTYWLGLRLEVPGGTLAR